MHGAIVPIAYTTVSGSSNTISFTSIPQGYQDLYAVVYARSTYANTTDILYITLNNDSGTNYSYTRLEGDGASATSARETSIAYWRQDYSIPAATATSNIFGSNAINILNYANTSTYKSALWRSASDRNGAGLVIFSAHLYRSTSAINRMDFTTTNGNFTTGSTVELFGVRTVGQ
jgi:hypothetical protein